MPSGAPAPYDNVRPFPGRNERGAPPSDIEAEQAVAGAMMLSAAVIGDVVAAMRPEDYYRPAHETIHHAILNLHEQGKPVDPITLTHYLDHTGDLSRVGGPAYLHNLVQAVPTTAHAAHYAEIVHELAERRRLIEAGTRLVQAATTPDSTAADVREALALGKRNRRRRGRSRSRSAPVRDSRPSPFVLCRNGWPISAPVSPRRHRPRSTWPRHWG